VIRRRPPDPARDGRRPDPWRAAFFCVLVLAVLGFAGWAVLGSSLLVVRHVTVRGNQLVSAAQVRRAADIKLGAPLATVNGGAAAGRVERIAPVLTATVSRSWPDGIVITVRERTPALAVAAPGGYDLVDEHGVTVRVTVTRPAGLPLLTPAPAALRGNAAVRAAAQVVQGLPASLRHRLRSVSAGTASTVTLRLSGGITVVWGGPGQATRKATELALLMGTHARYFDVSDPATAVTQG
jgi:cell division protein FtsQ